MQMKNLEETHLGALEKLEKNGISVCQNNLNIRQLIDGAAESTFMKNTKIVDSVKNFSSQNSIYEKWALINAGQAEYRSGIV